MRRYIILTILIILLIGAGFWYRSQHTDVAINQGKILPDKNRNLDEGAKKIYTDRIKKAEYDLENLKPTDSNTQKINDYIYLGQQYFGLGFLDKSKQEYLKVLQLDTRNETALVGLALTYMDAGDFEDARSSLEIALTNNPKNYNLWLQYIDLRQAAGTSNEDLSKLYDEALKSTNNYPDILTRDAQFQEKWGNIDKAIMLWQEVAKKNPDGAQIYNQEIARLQKLKK